MILLSHQINRRINFKDLFLFNSIPIFILSQVSRSNLNIFCKKLFLNISKDNKLINKNKLNYFIEKQYYLSFGYNRNRIFNYFINNIYNSQNFTTQLFNLYNINSNGFGIFYKYIKLKKNSLKKMTPACVLHNIKSTLTSNYISSTDRTLEESSTNRNQSLNNNNEQDSNSNNSNNNTNTDNKDNNNRENGKNGPLSTLNPVLNRRIYKRDSDMDDKSSNDSSMNDPYSSDEMETRLSRYWYYPSSPTVTPSRFPGDSSNQHLRNLNFKSFKVMTFNTLAQSLVDYKYLENDQSTMSWCKRRNEILKAIADTDSEVVCLQELDELDYINFFKDKFEKLGYECVYKRKLQNRLDGILTMYKKDRYELLMKNELNFSCEHEEFDKPQVALTVALRDLYSNRTEDNKEKDTDTKDSREEMKVDNKDNNKEKELEDVLLVTNTHLIFNKSRGDIKLYQLLKLLSGVKETCQSVVRYLKDQNKNNNNKEKDLKDNKERELKENKENRDKEEKYLVPNILICGDFNITPQSLIYNLLFKGFAPLKNSNPRCLSGQYLMFDQTYLTSSSGHNESGETLGSIKHYVGDVYSDSLNLPNTYSRDSTVVCSLKSYTPSIELSTSQSAVDNNTNSSNNSNNNNTNNNNNNNKQEKDNKEKEEKEKQLEEKENSLISRIKALDVSHDVYSSSQFSSDWYNQVLEEVKKEDFVVKPEFVDQKDVDEFLELVKEHLERNLEGGSEPDELVKNFRSKLNLGDDDNNTNRDSKEDKEMKVDNKDNNKDKKEDEKNKNKNKEKEGEKKEDVIYCPFKLKSAYSVDDGFNCEPAFTAYHGWQKGCVDYICYSPENTLLEGIYEMPLYRKVKENGDLPHKKCPASDHFSLVSQFRRFR